MHDGSSNSISGRTEHAMLRQQQRREGNAERERVTREVERQDTEEKTREGAAKRKLSKADGR